VALIDVRPHGGILVDLRATPDRADELRKLALEWPNWVLTPRQLCDLELLGNGGFSPLRGFLDEADHAAVCRELRLADGTLWPMPITLDVDPELAASLEPGQPLGLRDAEGVLRAAVEVIEVYRRDRHAEAEAVFGTTDPAHPGVAAVLAGHEHCVAGRLEIVAPPEHYDHRALRHTPAELRTEFARRGWDRVVAFNTRNPMHRAHFELTRRAAEEAGAALLLHPVVGITAPGDIDHFTRVRCYQAVLPSYPEGRAMISLLPLAMRMGGPREALWHAIIRQNHGLTHFIVGRDHAGPKHRPDGTPFYAPSAARDLVNRHAGELAIRPVTFGELVYLPSRDAYVPVAEVPAGERGLAISGTEQRRRLAAGADLPEWFTPRAVFQELRRRYPPRSEQGFTVLFTGLSGAGKSTVANVLRVKLLERDRRQVTLLDGDVVRRHLSSELGFSRGHRELNVRRVGFVASEITRNGGAAICALIAPFQEPRQEVRQMVEAVGGYVLVHVATGIEVCEQRDRKGLYAKARAGLLPGFTGVSDPYETPDDADLVVDTAEESAEQAADRILGHLADLGYLGRA
jgi:sulfate adenylyltransferase